MSSLQSQQDYQYNCEASILNNYHKELRKWSAVSSILSSSASVIGCLLIIVTYWCWRDLRTTSRTILLYIAIADLTTALGYIFGSATYLHCQFYNVSRYHCHNDTGGAYDMSNDKCHKKYSSMCEGQSFVSTWSSVCSFFWTTILAFYLYMTIVHKKYKFVRKIMPLFHLLSWGVGLALCITAVIEHWLGPALDDTAVSWCFVSDKHYFDGNKAKKLYTQDKRVLQLVMGKGWEMACYILIVGFYLATKIYIEIEVSLLYKPVD